MSPSFWSASTALAMAEACRQPVDPRIYEYILPFAAARTAAKIWTPVQVLLSSIE
jgi:hypothetical protein